MEFHAYTPGRFGMAQGLNSSEKASQKFSQ
jgi:hypothetical protein